MPLTLDMYGQNQGQGEAYWMDKWQAVLELEDCHRLDQALDFSQNLQHFAFIPRGVELGRFGFELGGQKWDY